MKRSLLPPDYSIVLCCGGSSTRFRASGASTSKQFFEWQSRPLFVHSLKRFEAIPPREVALVVPTSDRELYELVITKENFPFQVKITEGGSRRQDSVRHGLAILKDVSFVGVHDGARPFLEESLLRRLLEAAEKFGSVIPVLPVIETLKQLNSDGSIKKTHDRSQFVRAQTPQFFRGDEIRDVHESLRNSNQEFTDDAMMFESLGRNVFSVQGDPKNIKVTSLEDLSNL